MQLINAPGKLVLPFAASGAKNTIPVASQIGIVAGAASLTDGFPPLTRTPLAAGGVPPSGLDMNGILYELSAILRWANAGAGYVYDGTFAADSNVGGYPKGARVLRSDGLGYWFNTTDNNTTDPESAGAVAAGWVPDFTAGSTAVTMTSANVTLNALQYGKPIIVISGLLTANLNLIFPNIVGEWTVVNTTAGAYSITCKTAAGTGVTVTQGEATLIYGDATNIAQVAGAVTSSNDPSFTDNSGKPASTSWVRGVMVPAFINKAINTDFNVNQDAVSGTVTLAAGAYGHDGWKAGAGGCTYTFAKSGGVTTITISAGTLLQVIEADLVDSTTVTTSWTGTAQGRVNSGSYSASPLITTGISAGTSYSIEFNTGTVTKVQTQSGSIATAYERLSPAQELARCQYFYYLGGVGNGLDFGVPTNISASTTNAFRVSFPHPCPMYSVPTITVTSQNQLDRANGPLVANSGTTRSHVVFQANVAAGSGVAQWTNVKFKADSRL